jgi:hypothetical protein
LWSLDEKDEKSRVSVQQCSFNKRGEGGPIKESFIDIFLSYSGRSLVVLFVLWTEATRVEETNQLVIIHAALRMSTTSFSTVFYVFTVTRRPIRDPQLRNMQRS